jgi:hypothetical protein
LSAEYLKSPLFEAPKAMVQMTEAFVHTPRQLSDWAKFFETYGPEQIQKAMLGQQTAQQFATNVSDYLNAALAKG